MQILIVTYVYNISIDEDRFCLSILYENKESDFFKNAWEDCSSVSVSMFSSSSADIEEDEEANEVEDADVEDEDDEEDEEEVEDP